MTKADRLKLLAKQYKAYFQRSLTTQEISGSRFPEDSFPAEPLEAQVRSIRSEISSRALRGRLAVVMAAALAITGCSSCSQVISPVTYTDDVPNLDQVAPNIYRSGQITTQAGWDHVQQLAAGRHVHVIKLNFANEGSDALAAAMGFEVHELGVQPEGDQDLWDDLSSTFLGPDPVRINEAEAVLEHCAANPTTEICIGHCTHGQDRTGYLFGRYRVHHGWTKSHAYAEMRAHHFHPELHGIHEAWESFAP